MMPGGGFDDIFGGTRFLKGRATTNKKHSELEKVAKVARAQQVLEEVFGDKPAETLSPEDQKRRDSLQAKIQEASEEFGFPSSPKDRLSVYRL